MNLDFGDVTKALAIIRSERKIKEPFFCIVHPDSVRTLTDWLHWFPSIRFPEPETRLHYKLRMFVRFLKDLPRRIFDPLIREEESWT